MVVTDNIQQYSDHRVRLCEVARIQPGYLSRSRVRVSSAGTHMLLQAKDVAPNGSVRFDEAVHFMPQRNAALYRVSRGDILLAARGQDHAAHLISEDLANVLASSVFYILRVRSNLLHPAYLAWWINQREAQAYIKANCAGTGIDYISRQALEQLPVKVPPMAIQEKIERVVALWQRHKLLQASLQDKKEQLIQAVCNQAVRRL